MLTDPNNMLNQRGRPMGIEYNYHAGSKVFNSLAAHKLIALAAQEGGAAMQNDLMEVFFRKYFSEGKNLGEKNELLLGVKEVGLDAAKAAATIAADDDALDELVQEELVESHAKVTGVPFFSFPGGQVISGGESVESFKSALNKAQ
jgi:protein disulfide-isomerase